VLVKEKDINTRKIIVKVTDNGKPYPIQSTIIPRIKCAKADGKIIFNDCILLNNGDIEIDVTEQMTVCSGKHCCEISLFDSGTNQVLHTMNFFIIVRETACSDDNITSSDEFLALENALLRIEQINIKRITESEIDALFG
jgi:hypothetical protein